MKLGAVTLLFLGFNFVSPRILNDVTDVTIGSNLRGKTVAFGDYNADKNTDLFLITENNKNVEVLLTSREKGTKFTLHTILTIKDDNIITSVVPADFDGDSQIDLLIMLQKTGSTSHAVQGQIHWGITSSVKLEPMDKAFIFPDQFTDQPIVMDYNGDMIPDLMGEKLSTKERFYWIFSQGSRNCTEEKAGSNATALHQPQTSGFVDLNSDLTADLCLVTHPENNKPQIEQWINTNGVFQIEGKPVPYPEGNIFGQLALIDMGITDGRIDILLPACQDDKCQTSVIYLLQNNQWITLPVEFYGQSKLWGFVPPVLSSDVGYNPISLRVGDFNLDGYPDLLGVIKNTSSKGVTIQQAVLFENIPCSGPNCEGSERTFHIDFNTQLHPQSQMAIIPAFFDYLEDGVLDILVTTQSKDKSLHVHLLQQDFTDDACFLKVMVVSGLCFDDCPSNREPYGVNQWGPVVRYSTLNTNGKMQTALASQLTQSAYCPMQLPFTVFGLGQTPNFIENFEVGIPHPLSEAPRHKSWTSIIPNSQLIIIPYPNNKPSSWVNKLFVTPSRLVLLTGAALLGTCGFIAGIVGILHWREKVEDKREKLQEAHKFHFDAM